MVELQKLVGIKIGAKPKSTYTKRDAETFCKDLNHEFKHEVGIEVRFNGLKTSKGKIIGLPPREIINFSEDARAKFPVVYLHGSAYLSNLLNAGRLDEDLFTNFDCFVTHQSIYEDVSGFIHNQYVDQMRKQVRSPKRWEKQIRALPTDRLEPIAMKSAGCDIPIAIENECCLEDNLNLVSRIAEEQNKALIFDIGHFWRSFYETDKQISAPCDHIKTYTKKIPGTQERIFRESRLQRIGSRITHCHVHGIEEIKTEFEDGNSYKDMCDHVPLTEKTLPLPLHVEITKKLINYSKIGCFTVELRKEYQIPPASHIRSTMKFFEENFLPKYL